MTRTTTGTQKCAIKTLFIPINSIQHAFRHLCEINEGDVVCSDSIKGVVRIVAFRISDNSWRRVCVWNGHIVFALRDDDGAKHVHVDALVRSRIVLGVLQERHGFDCDGVWVDATARLQQCVVILL